MYTSFDSEGQNCDYVFTQVTHCIFGTLLECFIKVMEEMTSLQHCAKVIVMTIFLIYQNVLSITL